MTAVGRCLIGLQSFLLAALLPFVAGAQEPIDGPAVSVSQTQISPGDRVVVTIGRFDAPEAVISVCGNNALRGSADCNMPASEGVPLRIDGVSTVAELPVAAPPVPCPCVLRVATADNRQVAFAPIVILGHPEAPLTEPDDLTAPLSVTVSVERSETSVADRLKASAGGPDHFDVAITVVNTTAAEFGSVRLRGSAGRSSNDELIQLDLSDPGRLTGGQTWRDTATVEVPSLSLGTIEWRVTAFGAGTPTTAVDSTRSVPVLLIALGAVLFIDLLILLARLVVRRRRRPNDADENSVPHDDDLLDDQAANTTDEMGRVREPVG